MVKTKLGHLREAAGYSRSQRSIRPVLRFEALRPFARGALARIVACVFHQKRTFKLAWLSQCVQHSLIYRLHELSERRDQVETGLRRR